MNPAALAADTWVLYLGSLLVAAAAVLAWRRIAADPWRSARHARLAPTLLVDGALLAIATGIALRWGRIGHGPFLNMFEILASSLLSLGIAWRIAVWRLPVLRDSAPVVLSLLAVMAGWLLWVDPADTHLPATYEMTVLWFHVALGKVFLGCALIATGLAGVILGRSTRRGARWFGRMPPNVALDALAWRFMLAALVFESLMLIAGAVWAQDAWGRYWAWDPLETWAFITWIALVAAVHARITWRVGPRQGALMIAAVFVIAFLTFFGVPFVSLAPHKGAV
ncbi:MAG: cytochrome c biogenesis protein CcsA [Ramlibacter sp.]|nr:cytochrome c biogenesis protein CcsA [Ramlibacter sp.]